MNCVHEYLYDGWHLRKCGKPAKHITDSGEPLCGIHVKKFMYRGKTKPLAVEKNPAAVALGSINSELKIQTARENGKKGGRPKEIKD